MKIIIKSTLCMLLLVSTAGIIASENQKGLLDAEFAKATGNSLAEIADGYMLFFAECLAESMKKGQPIMSDQCSERALLNAIQEIKKSEKAILECAFRGLCQILQERDDNLQKELQELAAQELSKQA